MITGKYINYLFFDSNFICCLLLINMMGIIQSLFSIWRGIKRISLLLEPLNYTLYYFGYRDNITSLNLRSYLESKKRYS